MPSSPRVVTYGAAPSGPSLPAETGVIANGTTSAQSVFVWNQERQGWEIPQAVRTARGLPNIVVLHASPAVINVIEGLVLDTRAGAAGQNTNNYMTMLGVRQYRHNDAYINATETPTIPEYILGEEVTLVIDVQMNLNTTGGYFGGRGIPIDISQLKYNATGGGFTGTTHGFDQILKDRTAVFPSTGLFSSGIESADGLAVLNLLIPIQFTGRNAEEIALAESQFNSGKLINPGSATVYKFNGISFYNIFDIKPVYFQDNFGIRDAAAYLRLTQEHETTLHPGLVEDPVRAPLQDSSSPQYFSFGGHSQILNGLLTGPATAPVILTVADVRRDPVEEQTFQNGVARGDITDQDKYLSRRVDAQNLKLQQIIGVLRSRGIIINNAGDLQAAVNNGSFAEAERAAGSGRVVTVDRISGGSLRVQVQSFLDGVSLGVTTLDGAQLGRAFGSVLGARLTNDPVARIVVTAGLKTILGALGEALDNGEKTTAILGHGIEGLVADFGENLKSAAIGAVSSYVTSELVNALGLKGFGGEFASAIGNSVINQVITNIVNGANVLKPSDLFSGITPITLANAAGSFLGSKLAAQVKTFTSVGGQIGSAVGAAYGAWAGANAVAALGITNPLVAVAVVAAVVFIDTLIGGLIGSLFGGTPVSGADVTWNAAAGEFSVSNAYSAKGGSKQTAINLASNVAGNLNTVLDQTGASLLDPTRVQVGNFGMRDKDFVYRPYSTRDKAAITAKFKGSDGAAKLVSYGTYFGLQSMVSQMAGGDVYIKRALTGSLATVNPAALTGALGAPGNFDLNTLMGDLTIAADYSKYVQDPEIINAVIAQSPDSNFSVAWLATLSRASELGLYRRSYTDWLGGYQVFLDEASDGTLGGSALVASNLTANIDADFGNRVWAVTANSRAATDAVGYIYDTIVAGGTTRIASGAGNDAIDLTSAALADQRGFTVNGHLNTDIAVMGEDFVAKTATVTFAAGDTRQIVSVSLAADTAAEAAEKFVGTLSAASGVAIIGGSAEATILDGRAAKATLLVGRSFAAEGDGYAVFRVTLSQGAGGVVTAALATEALTATAGADYGAAIEVWDAALGQWTAATSLSFSATDTEKLVRVAVLTDNGVGADLKPTNVEANERFALKLTVTGGAALLANTPDAVTGAITASGIGTIVDATIGTTPLVWIDQVVVDEYTGLARFSIARSRTGTTGSVQFATSDRKALAIDIAATVDAGAGDDTVRASDRGDNIFGGAGNDTLYGGKLDDWLLGGEGDDTLNAGGSTAGTVGGNGNYLDGGAGNDLLIGREGSDWLEGGAGTDILEGGDGADILAGGSGVADQIHGGLGDDQYIFRIGDVGAAGLTDPNAADVIRDESGITLSQVVQQAYNGSTANDLAANDGTLFRTGRGLGNWHGGGIQVAGSTAGAGAGGVAAGGLDALVFGVGIGLEDIRILKSGDGKDLIVDLMPDGVFAGDRVILKDWFDAFNKIEVLRFADGNEVRIADFDTFIFGSDARETIIGTAGADFVHAGSGDDVVYLLSGNDFGNGGNGNDSVSGDSGNDIVLGADGDDRVYGGYGQDSVSGGRGNDFVSGDDNNDIVAGGQGTDEVIGGAGDDVFKYQRGDGTDAYIDALTNEWTVVWISGQGGVIDAFGTGYAVQPDGSLVHKTTGTVDGTVFNAATNSWTGRTRYDVETGTLYLHTPANANAVAANNGTDYLEFGIGIDINDIQFQSALNGRDLVVGIEPSGGYVQSFAGLADQIVLKEWLSSSAARGSIERFAFFNTGAVDTSATGYLLAGGTDGSDTVTGTTGRKNWLTGGVGDDTVTGAELDDILNGNSGQDTLSGGAGADVLLGGFGNDVLIGGAGADILVGGQGFDVASYQGSTVSVSVSLRNTAANTGDAAGDSYDSVEGLRGSDVTGAAGDTLEGDDFENDLRGGLGDDTLKGAGGDDYYTFTRGDGTDTILDVASGGETLIVDDQGRLKPPYVSTVQLVDREGANNQFEQIITNSETGEVVYRRQIDRSTGLGLYGYRGETDFLDGNWSNGFIADPGTPKVSVPISAPGGEDTIFLEDSTAAGAAAGADRTIGLSDLSFQFVGTSLEITIGTEGNGSGVTVDGGKIIVQNFRNADGSLNANSAIEWLQLSDGTAVRLAGIKLNASSTDTLAAPVDDFIVAQTAGSFAGGFGNDTLLGTTGNDTLSGGDGDDLLVGGAGKDVLQGGAGKDTVSYLGSNGTTLDRAVGVTVNLDTGVGAGTGTEAAATDLDFDTYSGIENVIGSQFHDTITGNDADNVLKGNRGNDILTGGGGAANTTAYGRGNDVLLGDEGNDTLDGGVGEDNLEGGTGNDLLLGGGDRDVLVGGDGNDILYGENAGGTAPGGNLVANAGFEDAGVASNDVVTAYGLTTTDLPGWTSTSDNPVQLLGAGSGVAGITDGRAIHLDNGKANAITATVANLVAGEVLTFNFNHALRTAAATGGVDVYWNGALVKTVTGGTTTLTAAGAITLTARDGDNTLEFRALGAVDGAGSVIDAITLTRNAGAADYLVGGAGQDRLDGGEGNDTLYGGDGDDNAATLITAGAGNTSAAAGLYGGAGDDLLDGGAGNDTLDGGAGNDRYIINTGSGTDSITVGGGQDDVIFNQIAYNQLWLRQVGNDLEVTAIGQGSVALIKNWFTGSANQARRLIAGDKALARGDVQALMTAMAAQSAAVPAAWPANPSAAFTAALAAAWQDSANFADRLTTITGTAGSDVLAPDAALNGAFRFEGLAGNDTINAGATNDTLVGGAGSDILNGGAGDDTFLFDADASFDTVDGGAGTDTISATVNSARINLTSLTGVEKIDGGTFSDVQIVTVSGTQTTTPVLDLTGVTLTNIAQITGNAGTEKIVGSAGNDKIAGLAGNDELLGGDGDDVLLGGAGGDILRGGNGIDTASYAGATVAITVNLATNTVTGTGATGGDAAGDKFESIENVIGTSAADSITGSDADNVLIGGAAGDTIKGGLGNDTASYETQAAQSTATTDSVSGLSINGVNVNLKTATSTNGTTAPSTANRAKQGDAAGDWFYQIENLKGTSFNDLLIGDDFANTLTGGAGNDALRGGLGNDTLIGEAGSDVLDGEAGTNTAVFAGNYADYTIVTGATSTTVTGIGARAADGTDTLKNIQILKFADVTVSLGVSANNAPILGQPQMADQTIDDSAPYSYQIPATAFIDLDIGSGTDVMTLAATLADNSALPAWLTFNAATRTFSGTPPLSAAGQELDIKVTATDSGATVSDTFVLTIKQARGANISGTAGDDTLAATFRAEAISGGTGTDTVTYAASTSGVAVNLQLGSGGAGFADGDTYTAIERVIGSDYADTLTGSASKDDLIGGLGDDLIDGGGESDLLVGGAGADRLLGGAGNDTIYALTTATGALEDIVDGGAGLDELRLGGDLAAGIAGSQYGAVVNLGLAGTSPDSIENVVGTQFADTITGNEYTNILKGGAGNDALSGGAGADTLEGGADDDLLIGGSGSDYLHGGDGIDTVSYEYQTVGGALADSGVVLDMTVRANSTGMAAGDNLVQVEKVIGTGFADSLTGDGNANEFYGRAGNDVLRGEAGNDKLYGEDGDDSLYGGTGNDLLDGGAGIDTIFLTGNKAEYTINRSAKTITLNATGEVDTYANMEWVKFADTAAESLANAAPTTTGISNQTWADNAAASFVIPTTAFADSDGAQADPYKGLSFAATTTAGGALPSWLVFNPATKTFSYSALAAAAGSSVAVRVTATDAEGASVFTDFTVSLSLGAGAPIVGTISNDVLVATLRSESIDGGAGADQVSYAGSNAAVSVNLATGAVSGGYAQGDSLTAIEGVVGSAFADTLTGSAGADTLQGGAGIDTISGGDGDDVIEGGSGGDILNGGLGIDTLSYLQSDNGTNPVAGVTVNLTTGLASGGDATGDQIALGTFENVRGTRLNDVLTGDGGANTLEGKDGDDILYGLAGNDLLTGALGNDTLYGGDGADTLDGSDGNDVLYGEAGADVVVGGAGNDVIYAAVAGEDTIDGGAGIDRIDYSAATSGQIIDLTSSTSKITTVEDIVGTGYADQIYGTAAANTLQGGAGDDTIQGMGGADTLRGGAGIDMLSYSASGVGASFNTATAIGGSVVGSTTVAAATVRTLNGVNVDLLANTASGADAQGDSIAEFENLTGSQSADLLRGAAGNTTVYGLGGDDVIYGGSGNDVLFGGAGNDFLFGEAGQDTIYGDDGDDRLFGDGESDTLYGGLGNDLLDAGDSGDILIGGEGDDTMIGGAGDDVYKLGRTSGSDIIYNYDSSAALDPSLRDVVQYDADVAKSDVWFTKVSGTRDLRVKILGTTSQVIIKDWFANTTSTDFTNAGAQYVLRMFIAGQSTATTVDSLAQLLTKMAEIGTEPASFSALTAQQQTDINNAWVLNTPPVVTRADLQSTTINEDGSVTLLFDLSDNNQTPLTALRLQGTASGVVTIDPIPNPDAAGRVAVVVRGLADQSGTGSVSFTASDGTFMSTALVINFTVNAVNDAPVITSDGGGTTAAITISENTTAVTTVTSTDVEGTARTYSISGGADAARFTINATSGVLTFIAAPNFEAPSDADSNNVYVVTVSASDGALTDTQTISVTVGNVNEAPVITSNGGGATAAFAVAENSLAVTTVTSTDPENATRTYAIIGGTDAAKFAINSLTGVLTFVAGPNYETPSDSNLDNVYQVIVRASDGSLTDDQTIAVTITDVNEAPVITSNGGGASASITIAENTTAVTTVQANDPENTARTYAIAGGADAARFTINAASGVLTFVTAPNYESPTDSDANNVYQVVVRASDGVNATDQTLAVTVGNANDAPSAVTVNPFPFDENVAGAKVAVLGAIDQDTGAYFTYELAGSLAAKFEVVNGELKLKAGESLDYEAGNVTLLITARDQFLAASPAYSYTFRPNDLNEQPGLATDGDPTGDGPNGQIALVTDGITGGVGGTAIGIDLNASDPDNDTLTYSFGNLPAHLVPKLAINSATGVVSIAQGQSLQFEDSDGSGKIYLPILVSDGRGGSSLNSGLYIQVTDVNEAPQFGALSGGTVSELAMVGSYVGTVNTTDPDLDGSAWGRPSHRYQIVGGTGLGVFAINAVTGVITTAQAGEPLNFETHQSGYTLTVRVTDNAGSGISLDQTFGIGIGDANEGPVFTSSASLAVQENSTAVVTVAAVDPEGVTALTYWISGGDDAVRFTINGATGALSFVTAPNYEAPSDANGDRVYLVNVAVGDGVASSTQALTITLANVNEAPTAPGQPGAGNIAENATGYAGITFAGSTDEDGDAISYVFADGTTTSGKFAIVNGNQLWVTQAMDYDAPAYERSFNLTVYAKANGQMSAGGVTATVNVTPQDDNLPALGTLTWINGFGSLIVENTTMDAGGNQLVLAQFSASDNDGDQVGFTISGGTWASFFSIDANGAIRAPNGINYEAMGGPANLGVDGDLSGTIVVRAYETGNTGRYTEQTINLSVRDLAEKVAIDSAGGITNQKVVTNNWVGTNRVENFALSNGYVFQRKSTLFYAGGSGNFSYGQYIGIDANGNSVLDSNETVVWYGLYQSPQYYGGSGSEVFGQEANWFNGDYQAAIAFGGSSSYNPFTNPTNFVGYRWAGAAWKSEFYRELPPIVFDLDGSGIGTASRRAAFDIDGDGTLDDTGWISAGQAFLALDRNRNGRIDNGSEISFMQDKPGAATDLEGLAAYDSNGDGVFDAGDVRFGEFLVWQDVNGDGVSDPDELKSLAQAGIVSISLSAVKTTPADEGGQAVLGLSTFTRADGTTGAVGDVALRWSFKAEQHLMATVQADTLDTAAPAQQLPPGTRLGIDLDGNGVVDVASEVFGLQAALGRFDSNGDARLTAADPRYADLRLWTDANSNNRVEAIELAPLEQVGLTSLGLNANGGENPIVPLPAFTWGAQSFGFKAKKSYVAASGGALFVRLKGSDAVIDPRAGAIGGATILTFKDKAIGMLTPIVLDLDGDGVTLKNRKKTRALFDMDGDGKADDTGWTGRNDGMLVVDRNGDGKITAASELSFLTEAPDAKSDLEALRKFDSNADGKVSAADARWAELKVWIDANENGISETGELKTLADLGITELSLAGRATDRVAKPGDNIVLQTATFKRSDGSVGTLGDVALAFDPSSAKGGRAAPAPAAGGSAGTDTGGNAWAGSYDPNDRLAAIDPQFDAMRRALENPAADDSWLGEAAASAPAAAPGTQQIAPMAVDDAWLGQSAGSGALADSNRALALMVQSMAAFGPAAASSDLLRQQLAIDTSADWLLARAG